jgi:histidine ammonia-lyase
MTTKKATPVRLHPKEIGEVVLGSGEITVQDLVAVARYGAKVSFSQAYCDRVNQSRRLIEKFLEENRLIYGVTTGFGSNVTKVISPEDAQTLQRNIIYSHAVSVGEPLKQEIVRATQFMILVSLGQGFSGVRLEVLEAIASLLNQHIVPFAPGDGSVGYLSPEAHMALVLMGEGSAWYQGQLLPGRDALAKAGLRPINLSCKEGLALITGTTSATAIAALALYNAIQAVKTADIAGAMSLEALKGTIKAFDDRLNALKKHSEQVQTAETLLCILNGSEIADKYKEYRLQDALSLRCIPQVHGAVKKALKDAEENIVNEMNSVSDNPVVYPLDDDGIALMGGNFDGTYVGMSSDAMCVAMANLAKMSERRIDRMVNFHVSELPDFLVVNPGLNSGYMIPQYTAAGLLAEIQALAHPATINNIPTCAYQEDVVSFAYNAARKAYQISTKLEHILAIELMTAAQALDFHHPLKPSPATGAVYRLIRKQVPTLTEDRLLYSDMCYIHQLVHEGEVVRVVEEVIGPMML